jgi:glycine hydroxymethyltransferase
MVEEDMREIGEVISIALSDRFDAEREALAERTGALTERYPLYPQLSEVTAA